MRSCVLSEESAAAREQVRASVEEVFAQIGEVVNLARGLARISEEMGVFLKRFGALAHNLSGVTFKLAA